MYTKMALAFIQLRVQTTSRPCLFVSIAVWAHLGGALSARGLPLIKVYNMSTYMNKFS